MSHICCRIDLRGHSLIDLFPIASNTHSNHKVAFFDIRAPLPMISSPTASFNCTYRRCRTNSAHITEMSLCEASLSLLSYLTFNLIYLQRTFWRSLAGLVWSIHLSILGAEKENESESSGNPLALG